MNENGNIDVRMSNYLTILGNAEMRKNFDLDIINALEKSVAIYAATTSKEYLAEYKRKRESADKVEEITKMFK